MSTPAATQPRIAPKAAAEALALDLTLAEQDLLAKFRRFSALRGPRGTLWVDLTVDLDATGEATVHAAAGEGARRRR